MKKIILRKGRFNPREVRLMPTSHQSEIPRVLIFLLFTYKILENIIDEKIEMYGQLNLTVTKEKGSSSSAKKAP